MESEIIYQLFIEGCSAVFDSTFRAHSKNVFRHEPNQEEKDKFIEACADSSYLDYLDKDEPYKLKVHELVLVE